MPKEATHWILAKQTWQAMPDGLLKTKIRGNKALYYLGAIAFDTPYYVLTGKNRSDLYAAAQRLHSYNADSSFNPFELLVKSSETLPEGYQPFLAGALTHIAADAVFHPFIYYFSGSNENVPSDQATRATARHRRLETALDMYFFKREEGAAFKNLCLTDLYRKRENEEKAFLKLLNLLYFGKFLVKDFSLKLAVRQHAIIHILIHHKWIHRFLETLDILWPGQALWLQPIEALFYATCQDTDPNFSQQSFAYRHPVTGEERHESINDLQARMVTQSLTFLEIIDNIDRQEDLKKRLAGAVFPSLYHGLPPDQNVKMHFFDILQPLYPNNEDILYRT